VGEFKAGQATFDVKKQTYKRIRDNEELKNTDETVFEISINQEKKRCEGGIKAQPKT
jgi:hypothetical protein